MEAARVAATRGHKVTLLESTERLGGQIGTARLAPYRPHLGRHVDWLAAELRRLGVDVRLNRPADPETIATLDPDTVIVATGATSGTPNFSEGLTTHISDVELLQGNVSVAADDYVVVYDKEGGIRGGSAAIVAAEHGGQVLLVTPLQSAAQNLDPTQLPFVRRRLAQLDVQVLPDTELVTADATKLLVRNIWTHVEHDLDATAVVFVGYHHADNQLMQALAASNPTYQIRAVGDCVAPRRLMDAVREGALAAAAISPA